MFEDLFFRRCDVCREGTPVGREHDLLAVRRIGTLGVIAQGVGQIDPLAGIEVLREDVELLVVVPAVATGLAGCAEIQFALHLFARRRIVVRRRIQHALLSRMQPGAGRLTDARRYPFDVAGLEIHDKDLVERIARITLRLKHHTGAVGVEVALAGTPPFERQLAGIGQ